MSKHFDLVRLFIGLVPGYVSRHLLTQVLLAAVFVVPFSVYVVVRVQLGANQAIAALCSLLSLSAPVQLVDAVLRVSSYRRAGHFLEGVEDPASELIHRDVAR